MPQASHHDWSDKLIDFVHEADRFFQTRATMLPIVNAEFPLSTSTLPFRSFKPLFAELVMVAADMRKFHTCV